MDAAFIPADRLRSALSTESTTSVSPARPTRMRLTRAGSGSALTNSGDSSTGSGGCWISVALKPGRQLDPVSRACRIWLSRCPASLVSRARICAMLLDTDRRRLTQLARSCGRLLMLSSSGCAISLVASSHCATGSTAAPFFLPPILICCGTASAGAMVSTSAQARPLRRSSLAAASSSRRATSARHPPKSLEPCTIVHSRSTSADTEASR
mmetsp:Transcript_8537/g.17096  ORF Transcript_8537/g.17096 Transcript_8537/m.17096 type:complete len:211 (-) Transcript_8537:676-1308(-)